MFKNACTLARHFTFPVIISIKTVGGKCSSGIGTFILLNDEGWILFAAHTLKEFHNLSQAEARTRALERGEIPINPSLNRQERRRLAAMKPTANDIDKWSVWWGIDDKAQLVPATVKGVEQVDMAIGQLQPFDKSKFTKYPIFKDPNKDYEPGTSLCRIGFPFYDILTIYDPKTGSFNIQNTPVPIFANEGILSRMHEIILIDKDTGNIVQPPFPMKNIETSNAGIKGQSGGPIYDTQGTIWAMQTATTHYDLDFSTKEKQYYHVGIGVHSASIIGFLKHEGIKFQMSVY